MLLVHFLFVYFALVNFCPFSLPLGVRGWLRLLIVVLPVLFLLTFYCLCISVFIPYHFCQKYCLSDFQDYSSQDAKIPRLGKMSMGQESFINVKTSWGTFSTALRSSRDIPTEALVIDVYSICQIEQVLGLRFLIDV